MKPKLLLTLSLAVGCWSATDAQRRLTMKQTIRMAQEQSISSMVNKNVFASAYWSYRSYKAERLPSLNMSAGLLNIDRSLVALQDAQTGAINYRNVYTLSNDVSLYVRQNISATGGTISLSSSLRRLDQFNPNNLTWYSQPITLTYMQPLFGFNAYKWSKKIEPHNFERAKLEYLESMESVTIQAVNYFWGVAMAELNYDIAKSNYENSKRLYRIAQERNKLGSITKDAVLQMELKVLNDSLAINTNHLNYTSQRNRLASFLGLREDTQIELVVDYELPDIRLEYEKVLETALANSSFELGRKIQLLQAERSIAQAKANRGVDVSFNARFGLSKSDNDFARAYTGLRDQEVAGFSVSFPIYDWGLGKGRVKMAETSAETIRYQQEQALIDYEQDIFVRVMQFNSQQTQCEVSKLANDIAEERFSLSVENFTRGTLSVTELNTAQSEKESAQRSYLSNLSNYWSYYFTLRRLSLYDYLTGTDIGAEFDKLVE
jgi:outer membrane protein TolC